jgi:hypothetical protein
LVRAAFTTDVGTANTIRTRQRKDSRIRDSVGIIRDADPPVLLLARRLNIEARGVLKEVLVVVTVDITAHLTTRTRPASRGPSSMRR